MVTRIKKILAFLEERKKRTEEQIRIKNEEIQMLNEEKEKWKREIKRFKSEFFSKIKKVKKAVVNFEFRRNVDFCESKMKEIESKAKEIEEEIRVLKRELVSCVQRIKALEKLKRKLEQNERASVIKEEEKMVNSLIMVRYYDK
jgi:chromosome segregation ATPase